MTWCHLALVGVLELRALDGLVADLGDPGRAGADHADNVADAPDDEGGHHDQEEAADHPGLEVAAEGCDHPGASEAERRRV